MSTRCGSSDAVAARGRRGPLIRALPDLFRESRIAYADCRIRCITAPSPDALVARLHLIAVPTRAEIVVCRNE